MVCHGEQKRKDHKHTHTQKCMHIANDTLIHSFSLCLSHALWTREWMQTPKVEDRPLNTIQCRCVCVFPWFMLSSCAQIIFSLTIFFNGIMCYQYPINISASIQHACALLLQADVSISIFRSLLFIFFTQSHLYPILFLFRTHRYPITASSLRVYFNFSFHQFFFTFAIYLFFNSLLYQR